MLISKNSIKEAGKRLRDGAETNKDLDLILAFITNHISIMTTLANTCFLQYRQHLNHVSLPLERQYDDRS